ncbi:transcriptional regulator [Massilia sp. Root351]|jgi:predicted DNA-binding transcriptional regulator YafY|uniref:helix-turn-helix transcriptional regulator n=1 Tax=Massilia sp. Root351 TaxID=1736522 RepID=UPI00070C50B0|nr:YafY family protein [Massilia sp. Root351]KQV82376.1 transcriptional regulator [Massilia sp. Root351]
MYHPTTRVLAVLELLQTHGRLSGAEMSRRLEVDGRTLRRYIVMLEQIGIPILSERGRHGGYALMPGFKLPPMMFTDDEALALALGLLAARSLGLAEAAPAVASAQAKLERIMPAGLKQRVGAIDETVRLDLARATAPEDNAALVTLSSAAQARRRVQLRYQPPGAAESERGFDPYGLAFYDGCWYAVGYCHLRQDMRTFRLDRIVTASALPQRFKRPDSFDALAHLRTSLASIPRTHATKVLLNTDLRTAQRFLKDAIGLFEQTADGVLLHNQADDLSWLARQLAGLPFGFHILTPDALRGELDTIAQRLSQIARVR